MGPPAALTSLFNENLVKEGEDVGLKQQLHTGFINFFSKRTTPLGGTVASWAALDSGVSSPGLSPGQGHCVVFLGKTLYSHDACLHPGV